MYQLYGYMARGRPPGLLWPWGFRGERRHERLIEPEHQGDTANNLIAVGHPNFVGTHAGHVVVVLEGSGGGTTSGSLGPTRARSAGVLRSERLTHLFQQTAAACCGPRISDRIDLPWHRTWYNLGGIIAHTQSEIVVSNLI